MKRTIVIKLEIEVSDAAQAGEALQQVDAILDAGMLQYDLTEYAGAEVVNATATLDGATLYYPRTADESVS